MIRYLQALLHLSARCFHNRSTVLYRFNIKSGERSSPVPLKGTRLNENEENMGDQKDNQDQLAPSLSPKARASSGGKELAHSVHSRMSARMLELGKPKGEVPKRPKSPSSSKKSSLLVDKKNQTSQEPRGTRKKYFAKATKSIQRIVNDETKKVFN